MTDAGSGSGKIESFKFEDFSALESIAIEGVPGKISAGPNVITCLMDMDENPFVLVFPNGQTSPQKIPVGKSATALEVSPDGTLALVCNISADDDEEELSIITLNGSPSVTKKMLLQSVGNNITFNHANDRAFVCGSDFHLHLIDIAKLREVTSSRLEADQYIYTYEAGVDLAISPDDKKIVVPNYINAEFYYSANIDEKIGGSWESAYPDRQIQLKALSQNTQGIVIIPSTNQASALLQTDPDAIDELFPAENTTAYVPVSLVDIYSTDLQGYIAVANGDTPLPGPLLTVAGGYESGMNLVRGNDQIYYIEQDNLRKIDMSTHQITYAGISGSAFTLSKDGSLLFVIGEGILTIYDTSSGEIQDQIGTGIYPSLFRVWIDDIRLIVSPDNNFLCLLTGDKSTPVYLISRSTSEVERITLDFFPDLASFDQTGTKIIFRPFYSGLPSKIYDISTRKVVGKLPFLGRNSFLIMSPDEKQLFYWSDYPDYELCAVTLSEGITGAIDFEADPSIKRVYKKVVNDIKCLQISTDGKQLYLYPGSEPRLFVMNIDTGEIVNQIELGGRPIGCGCVREGK